MNEELYKQWKKEEKAPFAGWDFSYIAERKKEEEPPWNYEEIAKKLVSKTTAVLDIGTGGGEIFSRLGPFPRHTVATEGYPSNVLVAKKKLESLGVKVIEVSESGKLPFGDREFDLVLNRHSAFNNFEIFRMLRNGGVFLTQQVGGNNLKDLIQEFGAESQFKNWSGSTAKKELEKVGFKIERTEEWSGKIEFFDVGAIVYFLKAIPWIVKDFSVDRCLNILEKLQRKLDSREKLIFTQTRFLIKAEK